MKRLIILLLLTTTYVTNIAQWRTVVSNTNNCSYILGTTEPPSNWYLTDFSDSEWKKTKASIGYADGDDFEIINNVNSIYIRIPFYITDKSKIEDLVLDGDYDDGFIAYLNGIEISRSKNLGNKGTKIAFNYSNFKDSEARVYSGGKPIRYLISKEGLNLIKNGENMLAIQVQNVRLNSSDLSSNFYLSALLNEKTTEYKNTPSWFRDIQIFKKSHLPIIIINTNNKNIPNEPKIMATMKVINNGENKINWLTDTPTDYNGIIGIERRGKSSQSFPKKQYSIELRNDTGAEIDSSLLGMKSEEDWVLYAPYADKSLVRNAFTYNLGRKVGYAAPDCKFCEVVLNGEYVGVYLLTEKIKRDKHRVNINKTTTDHTYGDNLTGGYIFKIDKFDGAEYWTSSKAYNNNVKTRYIWVYPKPKEITDNQKDYIKSFMDNFEKTIKNEKFKDNNTGLEKVININSLIGNILFNELSYNMDGYRCSTYMYKDADSKDGRMVVAPLWDYNYAFGNDPYHHYKRYKGWQIEESYRNNAEIPFWFLKLWKDEKFQNKFATKYYQLRKNEFSIEKINLLVDSLVNVIGNAEDRNFVKWDILNRKIGPSPILVGTYAKEVSFLKTWLKNRLDWMDSHIAKPTITTPPVDEPKTTIKNSLTNSKIKIYPNPFTDKLTIDLNSDLISYLNIKIFDSNGNLIYKQHKNNIIDNKINLALSKTLFKNGLYFISIEYSGVKMTKIIICK